MGFLSRIFGAKKQTDNFDEDKVISITILFTKDEIIACDYSQLKQAVLRKMAHIVAFHTKTNNDVENDLLLAQYINSNELIIRFGIHGYDEDENPLWTFSEIRRWAWTLMNESPWLILFLEPQSCLLIGLLCLGGLRSSKYGGFIPDFTASYSNDFLYNVDSSFELVVKGLEKLNQEEPDNSLNSGDFLMLYSKVKCKSLSSQFNEMAAEVKNNS